MSDSFQSINYRVFDFSERIRRDRLLIVCLIFIAILAIVTVSIVLVGNRKRKEGVLLSTIHSTTTTNDPRGSESTSASPSKNHGNETKKSSDYYLYCRDLPYDIEIRIADVCNSA